MMQIEINHLNQYYGEKQVLYDINLSISTGMFGLLGRNGAGKTTLLKTLVTLLPTKDGDIRMNGIGLHDQKKFAPSSVFYRKTSQCTGT